MGHVADVFTHERIARLPGDTAVGHVRYSTAGGSMLCNAQPTYAHTSKGPIAVAHNGNLVNGDALRKRLEAEGAILNTTADSEALVHAVAPARPPPTAPTARRRASASKRKGRSSTPPPIPK